MSAGDFGRALTPDVLIGIGNGGRQVAYTLMEYEWVLDEVLELGPNGKNHSLQAYIVDTDMGTVTENEERTAAIQETIEDKFDEYDLNQTTPQRNTGIEYINPVRGTPNAILESENLTKNQQDGIITDIVRANNLNTWWLERSQHMLDDHEDYGGGVFRRRALSKAIYHASELGNEPVHDSIAAGSGDSVYIVVGLGGGTGAGMAIDLAQDLQTNDVHLFGILPDPDNEGDKEMTNAYAMLSELEALELTNQNLFESINLLPYSDEVPDAEFDEAVAYSLVAHRNGYGRLNFSGFLDSGKANGPPGYAPFNIVVPHLVRYPIGQVERAEEAVDEFLPTKEDALDAEERLYDAIETYIVDHFDAAGGDLKRATGDELDAPVHEELYTLEGEDRDDAIALYDRLLGLRDLITDEQFRIADVGAAEALSNDDAWGPLPEKIAEAKEEAEDDVDELEEATKQDYARHVIGTGSSPNAVPDYFDDKIDPREIDPQEGRSYRLARIVKRETNLIRRRREILKAISVITEQAEPDLSERQARAIRQGLRDSVLAADEDSINPVSDFDQIAGTLTSDRDDLETELDQLKRFEEAVKDNLSDRIDSWRMNAYPDVETIMKIDDNRDRVEKLLNELDSELVTVSNAIDDATAINEVDPDRQFEFESDQFGELNRLLEELGAEPIDENRVTNSVEGLAGAAVSRFKYKDGDDWWTRLTGGSSDDAKGEFDSNYNEVDGSLFEMSGSIEEPFSCGYVGRRELVERRLQQIDDARDDAVDALKTSFGALFSEELELTETIGADDPVTPLVLPTPSDPTRAERLVERRLPEPIDDDNADSVLTDLIGPSDLQLYSDSLDRDDEGHPLLEELLDAFLRPVQEELTQCRSELEAVGGSDMVDETGAIEKFEGLRDLVRGPGSKYAQNYDDLHRIDPPDDTTRATSYDGEYVIYAEPDPADMANGPEDIRDAGIFDAHENEILGNFAQFAKNATGDQSKNGVEKLEISSGAQYDGFRVCTAYLSQAFDTDGGVQGEVFGYVKDQWRDLSLDQNNGYHAARVRTGGDWDLAMVTFIGGVFLDNIERASRTRQGYRETHESRQYDIGDAIRIHHTLGLDGTNEKLLEMARASTDDSSPRPGLFVYRNELHDMDDTRFIERIVEGADDDLVEYFRDLIHLEPFEDTAPDAFPRTHPDD